MNNGTGFIDASPTNISEFSMYPTRRLHHHRIVLGRRKKLPEPSPHCDIGFGEGFLQLVFRSPIPLVDGALFLLRPVVARQARVPARKMWRLSGLGWLRNDSLMVSPVPPNGPHRVAHKRVSRRGGSNGSIQERWNGSSLNPASKGNENYSVPFRVIVAVSEAATLS